MAGDFLGTAVLSHAAPVFAGLENNRSPSIELSSGIERCKVPEWNPREYTDFSSLIVVEYGSVSWHSSNSQYHGNRRCIQTLECTAW
jgi:hypothetical protein